MTESKRIKGKSNARSDATMVSLKKSVPTKREVAETEAASSVQIDLFVLRHGEAGNRMAVAKEDSERPLTTQGRTEMLKIAKSLRGVGLKAKCVYTSPLRRARETAEIVAKILNIPLLQEWDELKPIGNKALLYRKIARHEQGSRLILVGHEPYLTSMIGDIIGNANTRLVLKKGGIGKVRINSFEPRISGELRWLLTPKMIIKMS